MLDRLPIGRIARNFPAPASSGPGYAGRRRPGRIATGAREHAEGGSALKCTGRLERTNYEKQAHHPAAAALQMLQSGPGKNASGLAKACGVGRRTIFRDLQALRDADVPLEFDPKTERYFMSSRAGVPPAQLTEEEAFALVGLATEFGRNHGLPFYEAAHNAAV